MRFASAALILVLAAALLSSPAARAEVVQSSAGAFVLHAEQTVSATPNQIWQALTHPSRWWNSAHTYSNNARNLSMDIRPGGCWCERWRDGSVEHGRVVLVVNNEGSRTLRLNAALGPLQGMGAAGVLTFEIAPGAPGAKITMTYRVSGDPSLNLNQVAPTVDGVMMEQYGRLVRFVTSGSAG